MLNSQRSEGINIFLHSTHTLCTGYIYFIVVMQCMHLKSIVYMHDLYAFCIHTAYTHINISLYIINNLSREWESTIFKSQKTHQKETHPINRNRLTPLETTVYRGPASPTNGFFVILAFRWLLWCGLPSYQLDVYTWGDDYRHALLLQTISQFAPWK